MAERLVGTDYTTPDLVAKVTGRARYAEDFRTGRLVFSRGGLMAAAIDDHIQRETSGAKGLRDVLQSLVAWTAREQRAFTIDELPALIQSATGVETRAVIEEWLRPLR